jgi:Ferredoxin
MKTLEEINAIRAKVQAELNDPRGKTRVVVGMATCGIAAGAKPVYDAFIEEIGKKNLKNVKVTPSGCLGMCKLEPMAEVYVPGKEKVTYIKLTADAARKIVAEHIEGGNPVLDSVIGNV